MAEAVVDRGPRTAELQHFIESGGKQPTAPPLSTHADSARDRQYGAYPDVPGRSYAKAPAGASVGGDGVGGGGVGMRMDPRTTLARATESQGTTPAKLAAGIVAIGQMMSAMITKTSEAASNAIQGYAEERIAATHPSHDEMVVSPSLGTRLGYVAKLTSPAAHLLTQLAVHLGDIIYWFVLWSARIYDQLSGRGSSGLARNKGGLLERDELQAFKLVGAALLVAYAEVYDALEAAAKVVFARATASGQRYVAHRYGEEAAVAAANGLLVANDMLTITLNWFRLTGRALISRTAHGSARTFLQANVDNLHLD